VHHLIYLSLSLSLSKDSDSDSDYMNGGVFEGTRPHYYDDKA